MKKSANKQTDLLPFILIGIGVLMVVGVLIWQATRSGANASDSNTAQIPEPNIKRVSLVDAKSAFDGKTALFLDVRDPESYKAGHIPGAVNMPLAEIETRYRELDPNQWIITYCT